METLFVGQHAIHLTAVDSTNSYASEMLRQMRPSEGTIIYTFEQNKGRGQRGNDWISEPNKNIALSLILYPSFLAPKDQFLLTKTISLAMADLMAETLAGMNFSVKIKWPNDIYVNEKKIAGILTENVISENKIQSSVIGIGININQINFENLNATSFNILTDKEFQLNQIVNSLCKHIEARYLQLKTGKSVKEEYLKYLYRFEEWKKYSTKGVTFEGKIRNVSETGKLQVELRSGDIREFDLKEISFI
jgi:BirA family biotin operon repressor/biotin-[acetyl-CoA-carboxylase] ligase